MAARLHDKVAVVTGGSSGIGRGIAQRFVAEGARVVITDLSADEGEAAARALGARFLEQDVASESRWDEVVSDVMDEHGAIDVLVNNAGIVGPLESQNPEDIDLAVWRRVHQVNVEGVLLGCRAVIPAMSRGRGGSIVNMSSIASITASGDAVAYGASKAAVRHLTRSIAVYCGGLGPLIRCNSVHPGYVVTPMFLQAVERRAGIDGVEVGEVLDWYRSRVPLGELQEVSDIANAVLFLASDEARGITGTQLVVDGGVTTRMQQ